MVDLLERKPDFMGAETVPDLGVEGKTPTPEVGVTVETAQESAPIEQSVELPAVPAVETIAQAPEQDPAIVAIEEALASKRVGEVYAALPEDQQALFRASGEALALELRSLIGTDKFAYHRVWSQIRKWLHSLPGKDRSFLEQESNIVYNRVARMHEEQRDSHVAM